MINDCVAEEQPSIGKTITKSKIKFGPSTFHAKYIDDLTIGEALNLKDSLILNPDRPLPDNFHSRIGLKLDPEKSKVYKKIKETENYATANDMKLNISKTKFMLFRFPQKSPVSHIDIMTVFGR